jgi:hypothetical protein
MVEQASAKGPTKGPTNSFKHLPLITLAVLLYIFAIALFSKLVEKYLTLSIGDFRR